MPSFLTSSQGMQWNTFAFRSRSWPWYFWASARPFSEVYRSAWRTRSVGGSAARAPWAPNETSITAAATERITRASLMFVIPDIQGMPRARRHGSARPRNAAGSGQPPSPAAAKLPPESSGRCLRDRTAPGSAVEDLVLVDCHGATEPVLALGHGDVLLRHRCAGVPTVLHREVEVVLGREVARVRPPSLPLLAGGAAAHEQERRSHHHHSPVLAAAHMQVLPQRVRNWHILHSQGGLVNRPFVLDSPLQRRGAYPYGRPEDPLKTRGPPPAHPDHGIWRLERRRGIGDDRRALPGYVLPGREIRRDRSRGVLPLRPRPAARPLQGRLGDRS